MADPHCAALRPGAVVVWDEDVGAEASDGAAASASLRDDAVGGEAAAAAWPSDPTVCFCTHSVCALNSAAGRLTLSCAARAGGFRDLLLSPGPGRGGVGGRARSGIPLRPSILQELVVTYAQVS